MAKTIEYKCWGEYGPLADQKEEIMVRALNPVIARDRATRYLKKNSEHWRFIGEHNVFVEEVVKPDRDGNDAQRALWVKSCATPKQVIEEAIGLGPYMDGYYEPIVSPVIDRLQQLLTDGVFDDCYA